MERLDDFFIDKPIAAPKPSAPDNIIASSPADKMQLCIELLNDISRWTTSAARKPIEDTITQLTAMLTSVGGI